jgi:hypothetical protein
LGNKKARMLSQSARNNTVASMAHGDKLDLIAGRPFRLSARAFSSEVDAGSREENALI